METSRKKIPETKINYGDRQTARHKYRKRERERERNIRAVPGSPREVEWFLMAKNSGVM